MKELKAVLFAAMLADKTELTPAMFRVIMTGLISDGYDRIVEIQNGVYTVLKFALKPGDSYELKEGERIVQLKTKEK